MNRCIPYILVLVVTTNHCLHTKRVPHDALHVTYIDSISVHVRLSIVHEILLELNYEVKRYGKLW